MKKLCAICNRDYTNNTFDSDKKFCERCGLFLIKKVYKENSFCGVCGKRKIYVYKECRRNKDWFSGLIGSMHDRSLIKIYSE